MIDISDALSGENSTRSYAHSGGSTAGLNVGYRLGKLHDRDLLHGSWLDYGCADGEYTVGLIKLGADSACGIDINPEDIAKAERTHGARAKYRVYDGRTIPFDTGIFDGVLLNEVLEHVDDEAATLREIRRVLKPTGTLIVMSPNRWFPFEGHGMRIGNMPFGFPIPLLPWLPSWIGMRVMVARNYWPRELHHVVASAGFDIVKVDFVLPVLELYPWAPMRLIRLYRRSMPWIERTPLRRFGVSTLVIARPGKAIA
jgi:SAM-dependent methyltransferase